MGSLAGASLLQDWWQRVCMSTSVLLIDSARGEVLGVLNRENVLLPPGMGALLRLKYAQALSNLRVPNRHIRRSKTWTPGSSVPSARSPQMRSKPPLSGTAHCQGVRLSLAPRATAHVGITLAWYLECSRPPTRHECERVLGIWRGAR